MPFDGLRLREVRLRRALTLRELGALAGVSYDSIHGIETGKQQPRPSTVRKLADALGVSPDVFFADEAFEAGKAAA
ncbi:MAG: helix-turn-helix transcriptional regulator [Thermomicrobiales bacterium]|nr:helix-turn-helix transcriptional regulator [Thermomicrobiales bacterium]